VPGERSTKEVGVHALRGGDSIGDHTVLFAGSGERIELTHRASSRRIYSTGALRAARWLMDQPAGIYDMQDVLGFRS
jgi:4-hydroxy-tetrahydrodipicolinate reductase